MYSGGPLRGNSRLGDEAVNNNMIKKITALALAVACTGLVVLFIPGFAGEIYARVAPLSKSQAVVKDGGWVGSPFATGCPREPWPYGCVWRVAEGRRHLAKNARHRHQLFVFTATRNGHQL